MSVNIPGKCTEFAMVKITMDFLIANIYPALWKYFSIAVSYDMDSRSARVCKRSIFFVFSNEIVPILLTFNAYKTTTISFRRAGYMWAIRFFVLNMPM